MLRSKTLSNTRSGWWRRQNARLSGVLLAIVTLAALAIPGALAAVFTQPQNSSPIALSADQRFVWVVNPRDDSVSVWHR